MNLQRWYRFEVDLGSRSPRLFAVLLPDIAMNAEVLWNGVVLGNGGRFDPPIAQNFHHPLYFRVPASLTRPGINELRVRVATAAHFYGWLGPVKVGPDEALVTAYEADRWWRSTLPRATTVLGGIVVLLLGAFWLAAREPLYAWFGIATLCWTVASLNLHVRDVPMATMPWARLVQLSLAWWMPATVVVTHRLVALDRPGFERVLGGYAAGLALLALGVPDAHFLPTFTALHLVDFALALYGVAAIATRLRTLSRVEIAVLAGAFIVLMAIGLHDTLGQFDEQEAAPRYWHAFAAPGFILAFASLLTLRFVHTFRRAAHQNEELEERVRAKQDELVTNFERVRQLEQERMLGEERGRMMREMHDGLGSRLVETLSMVESGDTDSPELATALRDALDEMRLLIDSVDPEVDDLGALLASIRDRLEPALRRGGVVLAWKVEDLPTQAKLGPQEYLHVLRIVQEVLTNVTKRAGSSFAPPRASRATDARGSPSRSRTTESVSTRLRLVEDAALRACVTGPRPSAEPWRSAVGPRGPS